MQYSFFSGIQHPTLLDRVIYNIYSQAFWFGLDLWNFGITEEGSKMKAGVWKVGGSGEQFQNWGQ